MTGALQCPSCRHENRASAKFCEACAAPLNRLCANCGAELRPTAKFCDECGTPTASTGVGRSASDVPSVPPDARRTTPDPKSYTPKHLADNILQSKSALEGECKQVRDAAYRRLLKGTRAELHERLADWIEAQVKDAAEHDEVIGWHLEQAHKHRRELGPLDAKGKTLGERAAHRLAAAGRRALARDDLPVAAELLGRVLDRLDRDDPARAELALDWCEALLAAGDVGTAAKAIEELGRFIGEAGRAPSPTHLLSVGEGRGWVGVRAQAGPAQVLRLPLAPSPSPLPR